MGYRLPIQLRRRTVLRGLFFVGACSFTSQLGVGCSANTSDYSLSYEETNWTTDQPITMGFIYQGPKDDGGYNQSHAQAVTDMAALFPDIKIVEEASVPETTAVQETIRNMIEQDGATFIFPTSNGYFDPYVLELAKAFPNVQFFHPNQPLNQSYPQNIGSYFCYLVEPAYLAGMAAGSTTESNQLGLIIPKLIPSVIREMNSFVLGARSVNPEVTAQVIVTGDWNLPIKEAEAANSLIDQGADILLPRGDSSKVVVNIAKNRRISYCGYHINQADLAPEHFLTGIEWNWKTVYRSYAAMFQARKTLGNGGIPRTIVGGLKENFSKISPYGAKVPTDIQRQIDAIKEQIISNELVVFAGEIKDNQGNIIILEGDAYQLGDPHLDTINWFVEGIKIS